MKFLFEEYSKFSFHFCDIIAIFEVTIFRRIMLFACQYLL